MKKDIVEYLDFENDKPKVGRPKLADKSLKKRTIIFASICFFAVVMLLIFGYGTLFGFNNKKLLGFVNNKNDDSTIFNDIQIEDIKPILKDITIKENMVRKIYLTISPSNATNKTIKYKSMDENIATVDEKGRVAGINVGKTVIIASTTDGSMKKVAFNINVIKNASGTCSIKSFTKETDAVKYNIDCDNAKIKNIEIKTTGSYKELNTKKLSGVIKLSSDELKNKIALKVNYYPNNSKISKYNIKNISQKNKESQKINGKCYIDLKEINLNSLKYDITCNNASVDKIAYKIGNGSYVGIDKSALADTIIFEESDITRIIYFNVDYIIDGSQKVNSITKSGVIQKSNNVNTTLNE